MDKLKAFDAYPRPAEEFRVRTLFGAIASIVCGIIIVILVWGEFLYYLKVTIVPEIKLDDNRIAKVNVTFDITFPHIGCAFLGVDTMDVSGNHQLDISHGVYKQRLKEDGTEIATPRREFVDSRPSDNEKAEQEAKEREISAGLATEDDKDKNKNKCGDCYGAQSPQIPCCNTCDDLRRAYDAKGWLLNRDNVPQCVNEMNTEDMKIQLRAHEGCRVYGYVTVGKVAGNFHIAPGVSAQTGSQHVHSTSMLPDDINVSHTIKYLAFGEMYPGQVNPLDGHQEIDTKGALMTQYFINVVPTQYTYRDGHTTSTNQFSVTTHSHNVDMEEARKRGAGTPGMYISYDMSPISITYREYQRSFAHFLTGVCAIVGGVFTIMGFFDKVVYHTTHTFKEKVELGKTF